MDIVNVKKAVIFGTGKYGAFWYDRLKDEMLITGFIDNDIQKQKDGMKIISEGEELPVYSVATYNEMKTDDTVVLISLFHEKIANDIIKQLENECALENGKNILWLTPLSKEIEDEEFLKSYYKSCFEKELDLLNPKTYNEKTQWLKLYDRKPEYTQIADKYEVRKYVSEKIGEEYLVPSLGVWENFSDIDFDSLPEQFVLKCTHDSDSVVICTSKSNQKYFDKYWHELRNKVAVENKLRDALRQNWFYLAREWVYKDIKPRIIAEKYLGKNISDYRFFVFNGEVKVIRVDFNTSTKRMANIYTVNFEYIPCSWTYDSDPEKIIEKPIGFDKMADFAERLAKNFPFLRVDFLLIDEKIYFGETGFHSGSGFNAFNPFEYDELFGSWLKLPKKGN